MVQSSSCHAEVSGVPQHPGTSCHTAMGPSMGRAASPGPGDPQVWLCSPESRELHLPMVTAHQLGDEGQVGHLCGRPAKLEDDDEGEVVDEGCPLRSALPAGQAGAKDKGKGHEDTGGAWGESGAVRSCTPGWDSNVTQTALSRTGSTLELGREVSPFPSQMRHVELQTPPQPVLHRAMSFPLAPSTDRHPPVKVLPQHSAGTALSPQDIMTDPHCHTHSHQEVLAVPRCR